MNVIWSVSIGDNKPTFFKDYTLIEKVLRLTFKDDNVTLPPFSQLTENSKIGFANKYGVWVQIRTIKVFDKVKPIICPPL